MCILLKIIRDSEQIIIARWLAFIIIIKYILELVGKILLRGFHIYQIYPCALSLTCVCSYLIFCIFRFGRRKQVAYIQCTEKGKMSTCWYSINPQFQNRHTKLWYVVQKLELQKSKGSFCPNAQLMTYKHTLLL